MKYAVLFIYISFQNLYAEAFQMRVSAKKVDVIKIESIDSMKVSSMCFKQADECRRLISKNFNNTTSVVADKDAQFGNPASKFCRSGGGINVILEDQKLNEYDFCKISENFYVDSWALLKRFKQ